MAMNAYEQKKKNLQKNYFQLINQNKSDIGIKKNTSNLFRLREESHNKIDVRDFNKIIQVDKDQLFATVEGMATYETIVRETLKYNCLPTVVPELKSITVGGALAGGGIEASSFRFGLVHETLKEYEILLGDGRIVNCSPNNEYRDLYYGFPNTYGSLGYALKVKLQLMPAKKYVKIQHYHFTDREAFFEKIKELCLKNRQNENGLNYIEGVIFDQNNLFISTGEFADEAPYTSNYQYLNIYYKSIQQKKVDYLKTEDFIWRWDPDWFWCSKNFYMQNFIMRLLFGKFALKSTFFWKLRHFFNTNKFANKLLEKLQGKKETIIQDVEIPIENAAHFLNFFEKELGIYPIWICPTMPYQNGSYPFYPMKTDTLYINFGFWDAIPSQKTDGYYNRLIEEQVLNLRGHKSLYSKVYYPEDEFWTIFNKDTYFDLKNRYDPSHKLKNLYEKVSKN